MKYLLLFSIFFILCSCQNNQTTPATKPELQEEVDVDTCISVKQETEFTLGLKLNMTQKEYNQQISKLVSNSSLNGDTTLLLVIPSSDSDIKENLSLEPNFDGCYLKQLKLNSINNMDAIKEILVSKYGNPTSFHTVQDKVGHAFWSNPALQKSYDSPNSTDINDNTEFSTEKIKGNDEPWQWPKRYYWVTSELKITLEDYSILYEPLVELNRNKERIIQHEKDQKFENLKKVEEAGKKL